MTKLHSGIREEVRKTIIGEALALFLEKGFERTTMEDVAIRLNVSKPAIYHYFKNKEELFFVTFGELVTSESIEVVSSLSASDNIMTGASNFFDGFLNMNQKYGAIWKDVLTLIAKKKSNPPEFQQSKDNGQQNIRLFFETQRKKGRIHPNIDDKDLAIVSIALITGLMENIMLGMDPSEGKRIWLKVFTDLLRL